MPWIHTHITANGSILPCCNSYTYIDKARIGYIEKNPVETFFNTDKLKQLRLDMLNNIERKDICKNCYTKESHGFSSGRTIYNTEFRYLIDNIKNITDDTGYVDPKIISWDIRYSNLCNLKCRICGPEFSSSWAAETQEKIIKLTSVDDNIDPFENQYQYVEKIYFAGGEPLIMPEHYRTLKKLIEKGRDKYVHLVYNSNATKLNYNNNDLIELWKNFKFVTFGASIDAIGDRADYIRHGVSWNIVEDNLHRLSEFSRTSNNFRLLYSPTISVFNMHHLTDMHRYLYENKLMKNINDIGFNLLMHRPHHSFKVLPKNIKLEIINKIDNHIIWLQSNDGRIDDYINLKNNLLSNLDHDNKLLQSFLNEVDIIDNKRKESFDITFPEYSTLRTIINSNEQISR